MILTKLEAVNNNGVDFIQSKVMNNVYCLRTWKQMLHLSFRSAIK